MGRCSMPSSSNALAYGAQSSRLTGLDLLKALAAVSVVLIHAAPLTGAFYLEHVDAGLARLGVPLFLGISGYLAARSSLGRSRFRAYTWLFLRLHIIWAVAYWILAYSQGATGLPTSLRAVAVRFADGAYPGQYYFVILIQVYGLCSLLPERRGHHLCATPASFALGGLASGLGLVLHATLTSAQTDLPLLVRQTVGSANGIWMWWVFFAAGAFAGRRDREGRSRMTPRLALGFAGLACGIAFVAWPEFPPVGDFSYAPYARLTVQVSGVLLILSLPGLAGFSAPGWLLTLGRRSFGVFVLNPALLYAVAQGFAAPAGWPATLVQASVVIFAAYLLTPLFQRFLPWSMR